MKYTKYPVLKQELKELAKEIRYWKSKRKLKERQELGLVQYQVEEAVDCRRNEFRHKHIAYCQLKGRTRQQIECPADDNLPNEDWIQEIMDEHTEDVRACAERSA